MKIVFVPGPTASGKSARALRWAQKFGGAVINCDSIQCYQALNIGSAKPSVAERLSLPHLLFDYIPEGESLTAGVYSRDFFRAVEACENPIAFVVGGTGFYFQAIEKGMFEIGAANAQVIREVEKDLLEKGAGYLRAELLAKDPAAAEKISENDHYRLARAVEILRTHSKSVTEIRAEFETKQKPFPYPLLKIGIQASRAELLPRVRLRTETMIKAGLLDEVQGLLNKGLKTWAPLASVGYKECSDYLSGKSAAQNLDELEDLIGTSTLQLAKKQRTWFQRDSDIFWLSTTAEEEAGDAEISQFLSRP
jgi:tRNA dimethylallyltransferase